MLTHTLILPDDPLAAALEFDAHLTQIFRYFIVLGNTADEAALVERADQVAAIGENLFWRVLWARAPEAIRARLASLRTASRVTPIDLQTIAFSLSLDDVVCQTYALGTDVTSRRVASALMKAS
ncbi:MAG: hypothetical protein H7Y12_09720 [Sphingobacteriaceae bacterium]|nr:hypothetical protein [Cytophagaceae bacterium]